MSDDISELIADLSDSHAARRSAAARQLLHLGDAARAAAVPLVRTCGDADEEARQFAAAVLEDLGPPSAGDAIALRDLLQTPHADVGYWAATLIGRLGVSGAVAVGMLITVLVESPHPAVRQRAAWALGQIGPASRPALDALQQAASSDDPRLARLAQRAIEQITAQAME